MNVAARAARVRSAEHRRLTLEIRTLTVTLRSALLDLDEDESLVTDERVAMRRAWCERVAILLQDIRVRSMRLSRVTSTGDWPSAAGLLDNADAELERMIGPAA